MPIYCCNLPEFNLSAHLLSEKKNWEDVEGLCEGDVSKQQQTVTNVHAGRA